MNNPAPHARFKPSVTVAAVIERQGRYLMVEEQTPEGLRINQPAGHLEQGESPLQAVVREVREETAHAFTPQSLLGLYMARFQRPATGEDVTYLRLAFCGEVGEPLPGLALDDGILRWLWLTPEEIARADREGRARSALVLQCVQDHRNGRRHPLDLIHCADSLWHPPRHEAPAPGAR
ncbi:MAG TPA: NUDIX hydrolase [Burkholderiaceae bacterium]|nr:NUDIX hydrolase [Burkholderiaceae bacterium]